MRRWLWRALRISWIVLLNYPLRPLVMAWARPRFVFAIYGNARQVSAYYADWLKWLVPAAGIGGIAKVRGRRGFVVGSYYMEHELEREPHKLKAYLDALSRAFPTAQRIALVGRLPTFAHKANVPIGDRFVEGTAGTRFLLRQVARSMRDDPRYAHPKTLVVLGGAGRVGAAVCEDMRGIFDRVIAFDPRYHREEELRSGTFSILKTSQLDRLQEARRFINLTRTGDDILDLIAYLPDDGLLADDTHPGITPEVVARLAARGIEVQKAAIGHRDFRVSPRLPGWHAHQVPGCVVEALTLVDHPHVSVQDLDAFETAAQQLGFYGTLEAPREHD